MVKLSHKILEYLITHKDQDFTIRNISKILKVDYKNTYDSINSIKDSVSIKKRGNANYVKFKPFLTKENYFTEINRKNNLLKNKKIQLIESDLKKENPLFIGVIFGSYAKNNQTKNSDIDLCIIHDNKEEFKKIYSSISIHDNLEIHDFTYQEFISLLKNKDFNVGHEIVKHGIIIKNIESYYELIKYE